MDQILLLADGRDGDENRLVSHRKPDRIKVKNLIGFGDGFVGFDEDLAEGGAGAEVGEGLGGFGEGVDAIDDGLEFAGGGPFEGGLDVGAVAAVAADEPLLLHEERPEIEADFASGGGAAGHDGTTARETLEGFEQDVAADVLNDEIDAAFAGEAADFGGPGGVVGVDDKFRAETAGELAFGVGGTGADDAGAELFGDLNGGGADAAGPGNGEHPLAGADLGAVGEHVHGGAAGQGERGGGVKVNTLGQAHERASGDADKFGKTAIALDAEELAAQAEGFLTATAELAFAAENI